ncbi:MAG: hypothetical protein ACFFAA_06775 [Promethearchaeota archaeon]
MLNQIGPLKIKVNRLEELSNELEKRISQLQNQNTKVWLSILKNSRLEIAEIKSCIEKLPSMYKKITEKENLIRKESVLKKLDKFEKEKKKFLDSVDGLAKICEILEDNIRNTLSQI